MSDLRCTIYDVRCTILKFAVLLFFFISYSALSAQDSINNTDTVERLIKTDSLYPSSGTSEISSGKIIDDSIQTVAVNKKIKKQKKVDTTHYSPKKAAIWAAACPGLGQIYMKKYWKLPIVYGILGTTLYFVVSNSLKLKEFNGYIRNIYDSVPNPEPYTDLPLTQIETFRNTYRRNVQLASFGTLFAWGLSIVDAVVDAHLHSFDISDKLTMKIKPELNYSNFSYYTGIGVHLNFK
jgi:hypothetical protein